ncbi:MAG: cysteine hydrolase [Planctomycetes bacterium]|nr:cysteine hydrolase [Planctomycetota bacterium]
MSHSTRSGPINRVLVDLNTQCDFLLPKGALPVSNRKEALPNIRNLMNWARNTRLPVISSLEAHRPGEHVRGLPLHCVDRSGGQKKIPFTLLPKRILLYGDNTIDVPGDIFRRFQQVIFTKRDRDFLNNPKADRLVNNLDVNHIVVFGVVTEYCVKAAVLGLLIRRHRVVVVSDACGYWSSADSELSLRQMDAKGAIVVTTNELISGQADERIQNSKRPMPVLEEESLEEVEARMVEVTTANTRISRAARAAGNGESTVPNAELLRESLTRRGLSSEAKTGSTQGLA